MAQVPYNDGVPEVAPHTSVPDDYQHINANPDQFGALIAKGEQQLGQGAENAVKFYSEAASDHASNDYEDRANKILYGDSSKMVPGPDGQMVPDTGFYGLKGAAALRARPDVESQLDTIAKESGQGLSPDGALKYDNATRRYRAMTQAQIGRHADQQANTWYAEVNDKTAKIKLDAIAADPDNDVAFANNTKDLIGARVKTAQLQGGGDELVSAAVAQAKKEATIARIDAIAGQGNWEKAQQMTEQNQKTLGASYEHVANAVRAHAQDQISDQKAQELFNRVNQGGAPAPRTGPVAGIPVSYLTALQNEEGFDPHPKWDVHQWTVGYGTKAMGPDERPTKEQLDQRFDSEVAKAAATVDKINPNLDPGTKAALTSLTFNTGDAWTHSGLGQAVASGDLASAQKLFLQYNHVAGAYSPAIAARRANEAQWFGNAEAPQQVSSRGTYGDAKASGFALALADRTIADNPALLHQTTTKLARMFANQEIADNQSAKAKKEVVDHAIGEYTTQMWDMMHSAKPDYTALAGKVNHDHALDDAGPQKDALMSRIIRMSGEEQSLAFGPGYRAAREALFSEPGSPGHLDSIVPLMNDDSITMAGLKDLQERQSFAKSAPDKMATEKIINSFLADASRQMVHDKDIGSFHMPDAKGAHLYNSEFVPRFMRQVAALQGQAEKTGNWDKVDQFLSRDSIQKMVDEIYPPNQRNADRISAEGDASGETMTPEQRKAEPVPVAPAGIEPKAWEATMQTRPFTPSGVPWPMAAWKPAVEFLRADPTPERQAAFDQKFGASGITAKKILSTLGVASSNPQPQEGAGPPVPAAGAPTAPAAPVGLPATATRPYQSIREMSEEGMRAANSYTRPGGSSMPGTKPPVF